jgi:hypothetical protein
VLILVILILFLAPMLFLAVLHKFKDNRYEEHLAAIRATGAPTSVAELQHWKILAPAATKPEQPPSSPETKPDSESENNRAVHSIIAAFDVLEKANKNPGSPNITKILDRLYKNEKLSEAEVAEVHKYLDMREDALKLLLDSAGLPSGHFPLDYSKGFSMELQHLAKLREAERLLSLAAYVAATEGDRDKAFEAVLAGMSVNTPLQQEPLLISQLVRNACNTIAINAFSQTLGELHYSDEQLQQLQRAFEAGHDPQALTNAFMCERAFGIEAFENPSTILPSRTFLDDIIPGATNTLVQTASAVGIFDMDREDYITHMNDMIEASKLPYEDAIAAMRRVDSQVGQSVLIPSLSQIMIPALSRTEESMAANDARMREGMTAAAIERYTLANGAPPEQLNALTPGYLSKVPSDPFDGNPIRYQREGGSYTLYCVGPNMTDDGGKVTASSSEGDVVFRTRR